MTPVWEIAVHLAVEGDVFAGVFLCCPLFPRDVLDEIGNGTVLFLPTFGAIKQNHWAMKYRSHGPKSIMRSFIVSY